MSWASPTRAQRDAAAARSRGSIGALRRCLGAGRDLAPDRRVDDAGMDRVARGCCRPAARAPPTWRTAARRPWSRNRPASPGAPRKPAIDDIMTIEPPPARRMRRDGMLDRQEHAVEIDRLLRRQSASVIVDDRHHDADAGIGDHDVEAAEALLGLGDHAGPAPLRRARRGAGSAPCRRPWRCARRRPCRAASSMSVMRTAAPSRASVSEHASPMPDAPPVTTATLPARPAPS